MWGPPRFLAAGLALAATLAACDAQEQRAPAALAQPKPSRLDLPGGGVSFRLAQRGRAGLPGSHEQLSVELGDITGGQVQLVLTRGEAGSILVSRSLRAQQSLVFVLDGIEYELRLDRLENHLLGEDFAELHLRPSAPGKGEVANARTASVADEDARIERLLSLVAQSQLVFLRNGNEHSPAEAAAHLRNKWKSAGVKSQSAEQFIDALGSRSSRSGEAYRVRLPDGSERDAGPWLRELLGS